MVDCVAFAFALHYAISTSDEMDRRLQSPSFSQLAFHHRDSWSSSSSLKVLASSNIGGIHSYELKKYERRQDQKQETKHNPVSFEFVDDEIISKLWALEANENIESSRKSKEGDLQRN